MSAVVVRKNWKKNFLCLSLTFGGVFEKNLLVWPFKPVILRPYFSYAVSETGSTFEFLEEIVSCDHWNETSSTVLSYEIICLAVLTKKMGIFFKFDLREFWALKLNCNLLRSIILLNPLELFFFRQLILSCFVDITFIMQFIAWTFVDESL